VAAAPPTREHIWEVLAQVQDPEVPIAITDLGLVHSVDVEGRVVRVRLLPTFVGCPALDVIRAEVRRRLLALPGVAEADVSYTLETPWTLDRMSEAGRRRLRDYGLAVPRGPAPVACPFCGSTNLVVQSLFGPTPCRAIAYCPDCRNPVERWRAPADDPSGPDA
jgi:ring-1,2-phenylacetyl-CoA epoxidase subunit PaaD